LGNEDIRVTGSGGHSWFSGTLGINCNNPGNYDFSIKSGTDTNTGCNTGTFSQIDAGQTQFTTSSSRTLKENLQVAHVPDILDKVAAIDVYTYDFIGGAKDKLGLMAEDFHTVFRRGSDKLINGQEVEMALWLAVRELAAQNKDLSKRLAELEARLKAEQVSVP